MMHFHLTCVILLGVLKACSFENEDVSKFLHRLRKRQTAEELGPIPYTSRDNAPIPYQQGRDATQNDVTGASNGADGSDPASRDYQGSYPNFGQGDSVDDWVASADLGRTSHSVQQGGVTSDSGSDSNQPPSGSAGNPSASGRHYYRYQPPVSTTRGGVPTQTHIAGTTRYSFSRPVYGGIRAQGQTYSYPFGGGSGGAAGGVVGTDVQTESVPSGPFYSASVAVSTPNEDEEAVADDGEPVVTVFPSEQPVQPTYSSRQEYEQLLRQRQLERQRLLQQRQQQQQQRQQQQQQQQGGFVPQGQQRPIYTGSQQLGGNGQQFYYPLGQQRPAYTGLTAYAGRQPGGLYQPTYAGQQQPYYNFGYTQSGYDTSDYDSECPNTGIRIQINGIPCEAAIDRYGSYLCYRHEYTSQECCQKCRTLKNTARIGCEYGDHSGRCAQLQPYDCYDLRNRQSCCQTCERLMRPGARVGCEYGDMTPNCDRVRQSPGLCYIPENRFLCCDSCNNIRVSDNSECPWGDQNQELCQPFDRDGNIRINCYATPVRRICCQSCQRLQDWIPAEIPGCEYGDRPVTFNTGTHRNLNCTSFMRYFGYEQCTINQAVGTNCCYTCHRYSQG